MTNVVAFVPRQIENSTIEQRSVDGYINATAMCHAAGKQWNGYWRIGPTQAFIKELSHETLISVSVLVQSVSGGDSQRQGTWVHPQVAIHLAQWLSPKFAVLVSKWVFEWMSTANVDDPLRLEARKLGIPIRKNFAATMVDHDVTNYGMVNITNRISKNITGHSIKTLRKMLGIIGRKTPRDKQEVYVLLETAASEKAAADNVKGNNVRGNSKCLMVCDEVSKKVHKAFETIRTETKKIA